MHRGEDTRLLEALVDRATRGIRCALATVVATRGSTPRKVGTKMLVEEGRGLVGTVGGGCGEGEVIEAALDVMKSGIPRIVRVDLTEDFLSWSPAVCGGTMDIFVEAVQPGADPRAVAIHYRRPPDRMDVFHQLLVHDTEGVKVTLASDVQIDPPVVIEGRVALESGASAVWFTFPGAWHDIGRFHRADGSFTGFYANILTPPVFLPGHRWETTDLFLDVWMGPDGRVTLLDEDQLEEALSHGWITAETAQRARQEAESILDDIRRGTWPPDVVREWTLEKARKAAAHD